MATQDKDIFTDLIKQGRIKRSRNGAKFLLVEDDYRSKHPSAIEDRLVQQRLILKAKHIDPLQVKFRNLVEMARQLHQQTDELEREFAKFFYTDTLRQVREDAQKD